jgi:hypothetical protein
MSTKFTEYKGLDIASEVLDFGRKKIYLREV